MHIACQVTVHTDRGDYPALIRNISKTGFGLETTGIFFVGEEDRFEFMLPGGPKLKVRGIVARVVKVGNTIQYGIRFMPLSFFAGWRLQSFLDKHITTESAQNGANRKATL
jgi:hypothetical protein